MSWTDTTFGPRPAEMFVPTTPARGALLFLHDADERTPRTSASLTKSLEQLRLACVCPSGGPFGWIDRLCPGFADERSPFAWLERDGLLLTSELTGIAPRGIAVTGVGMGGMTALRLALAQPIHWRTAVAFAPACDFQDAYGLGTILDDFFTCSEDCRQDTPILHIVPQQPPANVWFGCSPSDPWWYRGCVRLHDKLSAMGVPHTAELSQPGGSPWDYTQSQAAVGFTFALEALTRELRRLN